VRSEEVGIVDVEGVPFIACRMVGRDVQRLEVVVLCLDLWACRNIESHPYEYRLDLALHDRQRVETPQLPIDAGEGDIDTLTRNLLKERIGKLPLTGGDGFGRPPLEVVQEAPRLGAGPWLDLADHLE